MNLGNVNVVISDRKLWVSATGAFKACTLSRTDYYPFGMEISSRTSTTVNYRFGYNGMEQDPEAKGEGNSYTTEFSCYFHEKLKIEPSMYQKSIGNESVIRFVFKDYNLKKKSKVL